MRLRLILAIALVASTAPSVAVGQSSAPVDPAAADEPAAAPAAPALLPPEAPAAPASNPATRVAGTNPRVTPEGAIDTSDPAKGFVAGARLRRTVDDDPYAALGIRVGSFILFPAVDFAAGYTTNASASAGGTGAGFGIVAPELLLRSDWVRHEMTLALRGSYEAFSDGSDDRSSVALEGTGRIDIQEGWTADVRALYEIGRDSASNSDYPEGADTAPEVHRLIGGATLNGTGGRVLFSLGFSADRSTYGEATSKGKPIDQADRDNTLYDETIRVGYALTPSITPFVEGEFTQRDYDQPVDDNGIDRTSHGAAARIGIAFDRSPVSSGEIAIGAERVRFDDPALDAITALTVDATLLWSPTELVTVTTKLGTAIDPTTDAGSSGATVYDGSVDIAYAYRENVIFDGLATVRNADYQGTGQEDWTYQLGLAATWKLNRALQLKASYVHEWLDSNVAGRDYTTDTVRLDLRVQH